ncbi:MAG TPA: hypothetical protein VK427_20860 [Kofleriaceae bacterium]|nr:hypothetical protein [Kofleriaceae bacterium]
MEQLTAAVRALSSTPADATHRQAAVTLRRLAEQINALPALSEAARIDAAANQLESSPASADNHVEIVRRALRNSQRAVEKNAGPRASARTVKNLSAFDAALGSLDGKRGLQVQQATLVAALESLTNTIALLRDQRAPFAETTRRWPVQPPEVALANAKEHALAMASADFADAGSAAARVIEDLASVAASYGAEAADETTRLRFQAQRLGGERPGVLDEARWIREALSTALDALEAGRNVRARDARDAVENISNARGLAFQRASIQDALRATLSAFIVAETPCGANTTARSP